MLCVCCAFSREDAGTFHKKVKEHMKLISLVIFVLWKRAPLFTRESVLSSVDLPVQLDRHKHYGAYWTYLKVRDDVIEQVCEKCMHPLRVKWTNFLSFSNSFHCR